MFFRETALFAFRILLKHHTKGGTTNDKIIQIAGICGGIGELMDVDPTIVRLATVVLGLITGIFPFVFGYIVAWWIVPPKNP